MNNSYFWLLCPVLLCSCGQTGPLYLPGTPPPIHVKKEKPQPETTEPENSKTSPSPATLE